VISLRGFLLLEMEGVLQAFRRDQAFLNQIFPHAGDEHFRGETSLFSHDVCAVIPGREEY
jgi:hypothetical protein